MYSVIMIKSDLIYFRDVDTYYNSHIRIDRCDLLMINNSVKNASAQIFGQSFSKSCKDIAEIRYRVD